MLDLKARINNQRAAMEKSRREVEKYKSQLKELETGTKSLTKQTSEQEKELKTLKQKYIDSVAASGKSSKASKEFQVTRERIRQIEAKAIRRLRHPSRLKRLERHRVK